MAKHDIIPHIIGAAVGAGGSFTVPYPTGKSADDYLGGTDHQIISQSIHTLFAKTGNFTVAPGAANISVTLLTAAFAANTAIWLHLDRAEADKAPEVSDPTRVQVITPVIVTLGKPVAASANAIATSQAVAANGNANINGTLAADGAATIPTPRNVVAAWTGAAVCTIIGEDQFGQVVRESSASGTSFTGKKAFAKVTRITFSAAVTAATVGTGAVLGLPVFLPDAPDVLREKVDGAIPGTAGALVVGDITAATATTGDVRGTYAPNDAPNGSRAYELVLAVRSPTHRGGPQFAG